MIFPVSRCALRGLHRPGGRTFPTAAMEVAFRGVRKVLCVAEKNDAAKGIADLLSKGRMRRVRGLISHQPYLVRPAKRDSLVGTGDRDEGDFSPVCGSSLSPPDHCRGLLSSLRTDGHLKCSSEVSLVCFETLYLPCQQQWLPNLSDPQNHLGQWLFGGPGVRLG